MTKPISCDLHDYFEIVCMRKSAIIVTLKNGERIHGSAVDIVVLERQEILKVKLANSVIESVLLIDIAKLEAINNPVPEHNFVVSVS